MMIIRFVEHDKMSFPGTEYFDECWRLLVDKLTATCVPYSTSGTHLLSAFIEKLNSISSGYQSIVFLKYSVSRADYSVAKCKSLGVAFDFLSIR